MKLLLLFCLTLCITLCSGKYDGYELVQLELKDDNDIDFVKKFRDQHPELDLWDEEEPGTKTLTVLVPPVLRKMFQYKMDQAGIQYIVVTKDVERLVDSSYTKTPETEYLRRRQLNDDVIDHGNYLRYDEMWESLKRLECRYSENVEVTYYGRPTHESRRQFLVKVYSTDQTRTRDKKVILIEAGIHAREWISPAANLYFIEKLLKDYKKGEPTATEMLERFEWWVLPLTNPDGYEFTFNTSAEGRFWRKNRRPFGCGCVGVDLNRNFDIHFGTTGVSDDCRTDIFHGLEPFSEVETQNVRDLVIDLGDRLKVYLPVHSYGQMLLVPWASNGTRSFNHEELTRVGMKMQEAFNKTNYYKYGTVHEVINKNASGSSMDWALQTYPGIYTFALELRPTHSEPCSPTRCGFILPTEEIIPQGEEYFAAVAAMAMAVKTGELRKPCYL